MRQQARAGGPGELHQKEGPLVVLQTAPGNRDEHQVYGSLQVNFGHECALASSLRGVPAPKRQAASICEEIKCPDETGLPLFRR